MTNKLLERLRRSRKTSLTDDELDALSAECMKISTRGLCGDEYNELYSDDLIFYYLLSQIDLFNGDIVNYNNSTMLYNSTLAEFRRLATDQAVVNKKDLCYKNIW